MKVSVKHITNILYSNLPGAFHLHYSVSALDLRSSISLAPQKSRQATRRRSNWLALRPASATQPKGLIYLIGLEGDYGWKIPD
jgi:hypothetical protein